MKHTHPTLEQIVFTKVRDHLLKQRVRSANGHGGCRYRDFRWNACAIGCLISEENYTSMIEGMSIGKSNSDEIRELLATLADEGLDVSRFFLAELQDIHDQSHPNTWPTELLHFAETHGLVWELPEPEGTRL